MVKRYKKRTIIHTHFFLILMDSESKKECIGSRFHCMFKHLVAVRDPSIFNAAISAGDLKTVEYLVDNKIFCIQNPIQCVLYNDKNEIKDTKWMHPLHIAVIWGRVNIVDYFVNRKGLNINFKRWVNRSDCEKNSVDRVYRSALADLVLHAIKYLSVSHLGTESISFNEFEKYTRKLKDMMHYLIFELGANEDIDDSDITFRKEYDVSFLDIFCDIYRDTHFAFEDCPHIKDIICMLIQDYCDDISLDDILQRNVAMLPFIFDVYTGTILHAGGKFLVDFLKRGAKHFTHVIVDFRSYSPFNVHVEGADEYKYDIYKSAPSDVLSFLEKDCMYVQQITIQFDYQVKHWFNNRSLCRNAEKLCNTYDTFFGSIRKACRKTQLRKMAQWIHTHHKKRNTTLCKLSHFVAKDLFRTALKINIEISDE